MCIYVHEKLKPKAVKFRSSPGSEIVAIEVSLKRQKFLVASMYKPPATLTTDFVSNVSDFLAECSKTGRELLLFGDTNTDAFGPEFVNRFGNLLASFRLQQLVSDATHKGHCIDQMFATSIRLLYSQVGVGPPIENHHAFVWSQLCVPELTVPKSSFEHWKWTDADWDHVRFDLLDKEDGGERDWKTEIGEEKTVCEAASYFQQQISLAQMHNVPHKRITIRGTQCPWLDKPTRQQINRKNALFRALKRSGNDPSALAKYKKTCKKVKSACLEAKRRFMESAFSGVQNPRDFWKTVKKFTSKRSNATLPLQRPDGTVAFSAGEKAAALSTEFQKNFNWRYSSVADFTRRYSSGLVV